MMSEFIGKNVKVDYVQEVGWKRPQVITFNKKSYNIRKIISHWEEHSKEKYWRDRKHRVWYEVKLDDGNIYQLYWDRGAYGKGRDWILLKKV